MADIAALQTAASRYGDVAGFGSVTADGIMGPQTENAVKGALQWIASNIADEADTANGLVADLTSQQAIVSSAGGLTTYLNQVADANGIGGPNIDIPQSGGGGRLLPGLPKLPTSAASALDAVKKLPTWLKVAGALGLALLGWHAYKAYKKHAR